MTKKLLGPQGKHYCPICHQRFKYAVSYLNHLYEHGSQLDDALQAIFSELTVEQYELIKKNDFYWG